MALFFLSFLSLFLEMVCIRFIPACVSVISFFTNIILIACFLGLGVGLSRSTQKTNSFPFSLRLLFLVGTTYIFSVFGTRNRESELEFWDYSLYGLNIPFSFFPIITLCILFTVTVFVFIPLGERIREHFDPLPPLQAYTINIFGSIAGVLCFFILSKLNLGPIYWFIPVVVLSFFFMPEHNAIRAAAYLTIFLLFGVESTVIREQIKTYWSPYYRISIRHLDPENTPIGFWILVNNIFHQTTINTSIEDDSPFVKGKNFEGDYTGTRKRVTLPFQLSRNPQRILILGSGTGNDVAAALTHTRATIDAVEIDPLIASLGKTLHPEKPYANPRVHLYIGDARSFLKTTRQSYDLVIFATLDSAKIFSQVSSVRLDNYVYTMESLHEVRKILKPDGMLTLTFFIRKPFIGKRLQLMLLEVFQQKPVILKLIDFHTMFVIGGKQKHFVSDSIVARTTDPNIFWAKQQHPVPPATDDWPFLYMQGKFIPSMYIKAISLVFILSLYFIFLNAPGAKPSYSSANFFFLGAGFMLLETRSITSMALLFGSTWTVNAAVILSILVMILLGNTIALRQPIRNKMLPYGFLALSLILCNFLPSPLFTRNSPMNTIFICLLISLPLFFASIIFSTTFKEEKNPSASLGFNLLGAVAGGLLENASLIFGLKSLYILAMTLYGLSCLCYHKFK